MGLKGLLNGVLPSDVSKGMYKAGQQLASTHFNHCAAKFVSQVGATQYDFEPFTSCCLFSKGNRMSKHTLTLTSKSYLGVVLFSMHHGISLSLKAMQIYYWNLSNLSRKIQIYPECNGIISKPITVISLLDPTFSLLILHGGSRYIS